MKRLIVLIIAILIPTAVVAKGECDTDLEKFCKSVAEAGPCMAQHEAELSPACRAAREAHSKAPAKKNP
jgi:hypothetical protein